MKSLHLKVSQETHDKFCAIAGDRKKGVVQAEIFTDAVNKMHKKMFKPNDVIANMLSTENE